MSKRVLFACLLFIAGMSSGLALARYGGETISSKPVLENTRVAVTEVTLPPGAERKPYTRPSDQVIVFLDEADYESTDAAGKKLVKHRRAGEVIWHDKGEAAPLLVNTGKRPYRNLVIALKDATAK